MRFASPAAALSAACFALFGISAQAANASGAELRAQSLMNEASQASLDAGAQRRLEAWAQKIQASDALSARAETSAQKAQMDQIASSFLSAGDAQANALSAAQALQIQRGQMDMAQSAPIAQNQQKMQAAIAQWAAAIRRPSVSVSSDSHAVQLLIEATDAARAASDGQRADAQAIETRVYAVGGDAKLLYSATALGEANEIISAESTKSATYVARVKTSLSTDGAESSSIETGSVDSGVAIHASWSPRANGTILARVAINISSLDSLNEVVVEGAKIETPTTSVRETFAQFPLDGRPHLVAYWANGAQTQPTGLFSGFFGRGSAQRGQAVFAGAPESFKSFDARQATADPLR